MRIKDLYAAERPREKLLAHGARSLGSAELLAILIGSGYGRKSALDLANELLIQVEGKMTRIAAMGVDNLIRPGIGKARAVRIIAALEAGRRAFEEKEYSNKAAITDPGMVYDMMLPILKNIDHEECWILYLNRAGFLISRERLTSGGPNSTQIDPAWILKKAVEKQASAVIMVHNHPSGNPTPGKADIEMTRLVRKALGALNIELLDHVVVAEDSYFSFSEDRTGVRRGQSLPPKAKSPASPRPGTM